MRCSASRAPVYLWRAVQLLGLLIGALLLRQYRHWGETPHSNPTTAATAHFSASLRALRPVVEGKRAALAASKCPSCESSGDGTRSSTEEALGELEHLEGRLLHRVWPASLRAGLPLATLAALAPPTHHQPTATPARPAAASTQPPTTSTSATAVKPAATGVASAPATAASDSNPSLNLVHVQQVAAETPLRLLARLTPATATPRTFVVYAPSQHSGQATSAPDATGEHAYKMMNLYLK